ncbi:MAG: T9SS C-terminal target domain-containing protein [Flavobacterium sp.]|nr:MAG: T9SS C-terminal target domain-containing protein [Flavobacterium sp.]
MVQFLLDNREIYFVPVVNPDGYFYNETTNPNGGGFWRKNRNPNSGGCAGVDLNRNYSFGYGVNGSCSSTDPCSGTYRGTAPFSEPETAAVRDFLDQVEPNTAFSTHSTAGTYLMPYGYDTSPPEFNTYSEWASAFLNENDYPYGVTFQMLGYTSCGTTRDYLHSEGIYGWTPEIDGNGFWPTPSTIFALVDENIRPLFYQSWIAGAYLDVQSHTQIGDALPGESFQLVVEIKNTGVGAEAQNVSVIISTNHPNVTVPTANGYGSVAARTRKDNSASPFIISLDPGFNDRSFLLNVNTYQDGVENESIEIPIYVGESTTLFFDDAEGGAGNWTATGNGISWGVVSDDAYSGNSSFGDSDGGNGENNTLNYFTLNESFDFTGDITPVLTFACKWSVEIDDDVDLQISTDGGSNWTTLTQYSGNNDWMTEQLELDAYAGFNDVRIRFKMDTDNSIPGDGFYFDDLKVRVFDNSILGGSNKETFGISVFPNPFSNTVTIKADKDILEDIAVVKLYDISGRSFDVAIVKDVSGLHISNTGKLVTGIYFLNVINTAGEVITVKKLVKI